MKCIAMLAIVSSMMAGACGGKTVEAEHPAVASLVKFLPATLEAPRPKTLKPTDARSLHVRVWADAAVRANPKWKDDVTDQLDYATQLLTPLVGAKIVIDDWKDWDRAPASELKAGVRPVDELEAADPGEHVSWVIGYVAPVEPVTKVLEELGEGRVLGKHVVVHAWNEKAETERLAAVLPTMKDTERAEVISAHKRHHQTVAVLHALARTLGAIDETDPTWLQNPAYSVKQSTWSDRNRDLIEMGIDMRLEQAETKVVAAKTLDAIDKSEYGGWVERSKDEVVAALKTAIEKGKAGATASDIPAAAFDEWERIDTLRKQHPEDLAPVIEELDHLLAAYPANATMHQMKCDMLLVKPGVKSPVTLAACARVSELAPGDPRPHLAIGEAIARAQIDPKTKQPIPLDAKTRVAAHDELAKAEPKIGNLTTNDDIAAMWKRLVGDYARLSVTWTEGALAKAVAASVKVEGWPEVGMTVQARVRYGVPKTGKGMAPENDLALLGQIQQVFALIGKDKYGEASAVVAKAEKTWPAAPGLAAMRCDIAMRQNSVEAAKAECRRAIAAQPDESWALYLSGVLDLKDTSESGTKSGIEMLKRAIVADPELGQAWRTLAKAYSRAHDKAALDELSKAYSARFNAPLPGA